MGKAGLDIINNETEQKNFLGFVFGDDLYFYKDILEGLPLEEQINFIENKPDFVQEDYDRMFSCNSLYSKSAEHGNKILREIKSGIVKTAEFRQILSIKVKKAHFSTLKY